tara:strand:- start:529 stop:660 length:132 start_codon:yes stop_codon:yes gene_type:complete
MKGEIEQTAINDIINILKKIDVTDKTLNKIIQKLVNEFKLKKQ